MCCARTNCLQWLATWECWPRGANRLRDRPPGLMGIVRTIRTDTPARYPGIIWNEKRHIVFFYSSQMKISGHGLFFLSFCCRHICSSILFSIVYSSTFPLDHECTTSIGQSQHPRTCNYNCLNIEMVILDQLTGRNMVVEPKPRAVLIGLAGIYPPAVPRFRTTTASEPNNRSTQHNRPIRIPFWPAT